MPVTNILKSNEHDAKPLIKLLKEDHDKVKDLFEDYQELRHKNSSNEQITKVVQEICKELTIHASAEEAIVYPMARQQINNDELIDEADAEHAEAKELINELKTMSPNDSQYDAKVNILQEHIEYHVKEEEEQMFPQLQKKDINGQVLADEVLNFKKHSGS